MRVLSTVTGHEDLVAHPEHIPSCAQVLKSEVLPPRATVLDVGCGTGLLCEALAGSASSVTGCDASAGMVEVFRQKLQRIGAPQNIRVVQADLTAADPLGDQRFDVVTSVMTLHHLPDIPGEWETHSRIPPVFAGPSIALMRSI